MPTSIMAVILLTKEPLIKTKLDAAATHPIIEVCPSLPILALPISAHPVLRAPNSNYCRGVFISLFWYSLSVHSILLLPSPLLQYWQFPKHKITVVSLSEFHMALWYQCGGCDQVGQALLLYGFPRKVVRWCVVLYTLRSPLLRNHQIFIDDVFEKEVIFFDPEI